MASLAQIVPAQQCLVQRPAMELPRPRRRVTELDILRGFLLLWMTLTHLPTKASIISNQTFGFVSGAEGFIFLSAFMVGQLEFHIEGNSGFAATVRDIRRRTFRIYVYHCALLVGAFTLVAQIGVSFHRLALENLLSYYIQSPNKALLAAALLEYRPSLFDILPMYIVFMALTPVARGIARRWTWAPVIGVSLAVWVAAQFGLRKWMYAHVDLFGLSVPESSTGAFDLYAWQLLWMAGLALGTMSAGRFSGATESNRMKGESRVRTWVLILSVAVAACFVVLRYSPADHWMNAEWYGRLIDKWHLGAARIVNFAAITTIVVRYGSRIAAFVILKPLALLGRASIEVFSAHVVCSVAGQAMSKDADPQLTAWQQVTLLAVTLTVLFSTAAVCARRNQNRRRER